MSTEPPSTEPPPTQSPPTDPTPGSDEGRGSPEATRPATTPLPEHLEAEPPYWRLEAEPPYWMVVFWSTRTDDDDGYAEAAAAMVELAARQPGFLGVESVRDGDAVGRPGITVSYWRDEASIAAWRHHVEHAAIRREGVARWYAATALTVGRVERRHEWRR